MLPKMNGHTRADTRLLLGSIYHSVASCERGRALMGQQLTLAQLAMLWSWLRQQFTEHARLGGQEKRGQAGRRGQHGASHAHARASKGGGRNSVVSTASMRSVRSSSAAGVEMLSGPEVMCMARQVVAAMWGTASQVRWLATQACW